MSDAPFADQLLDAIAARGAPICVGIDPNFDLLPAVLTEGVNANDTAAVLDAFWRFGAGVLDAVSQIAPVVKLQSAYFEQYQSAGVELYYELVHEARERGLLVIGDVKRGDIGATSAAYAAGHLDEVPSTVADEQATPDAITVNPMLGMDGIEPFIQMCEKSGKGLFVLVRTSNPGSRDFQDALLADGRTWSEHLADTLAERVQTPALVGRHGYSSIGAVVGATQPHTMTSLRRRLPKSIFLLPGYGTQGATAEMTRAAFDADGRGAIVSASRSVLYPKGDGDWKSLVARAARTMHQEVRSMLHSSIR